MEAHLVAKPCIPEEDNRPNRTEVQEAGGSEEDAAVAEAAVAEADEEGGERQEI